MSRTGEEIIAQVPELFDIAQIAISNWTSTEGSTGTNDALAMNMTRFAHEALCSEYSDIGEGHVSLPLAENLLRADRTIDGAVFTHGTNSLEETLFLMDALINCGKPIVGLGASK